MKLKLNNFDDCAPCAVAFWICCGLRVRVVSVAIDFRFYFCKCKTERARDVRRQKSFGNRWYRVDRGWAVREEEERTCVKSSQCRLCSQHTWTHRRRLSLSILSAPLLFLTCNLHCIRPCRAVPCCMSSSFLLTEIARHWIACCTAQTVLRVPLFLLHFN